MANSNTTLIGATAIHECVLEPFRWVSWTIGGWDGKRSVIFADEKCVMIFDTEKGVVHSLFPPTYTAHAIAKVDELIPGIGLYEVEVKITLVMIPLANVPSATWDLLLRLTRHHRETFQRIIRLRNG